MLGLGKGKMFEVEFELEFNNWYRAVIFPAESDIIKRVSERAFNNSEIRKKYGELKEIREAIREGYTSLRIEAIQEYIQLRRGKHGPNSAFRKATQFLDGLIDVAIGWKGADIVDHEIFPKIISRKEGKRKNASVA
jgi:hypothetical protein